MIFALNNTSWDGSEGLYEARSPMSWTAKRTSDDINHYTKTSKIITKKKLLYQQTSSKSILTWWKMHGKYIFYNLQDGMNFLTLDKIIFAFNNTSWDGGKRLNEGYVPQEPNFLDSELCKRIYKRTT